MPEDGEQDFFERYNISTDNVDAVVKAIQDATREDRLEGVSGGDLILGFGMYLGGSIRAMENLPRKAKAQTVAEAADIFYRGLMASILTEDEREKGPQENE